MDSKAPIAVRIEREGKLLLQSVISAATETTLMNVIEQAFGKIPGGTDAVDAIYTGCKSFDRHDLFTISHTTTIKDAAIAIGTCTKVLCILKAEIPWSKQNKPNAFELLMDRASATRFPDKKTENDGRDVLYNKLVDYMQCRGAGFKIFQKSDMEFFMSSVVSILWRLDGQWAKLLGAANVSKPPENLHFKPDDHESFRVLYHGDHKKKTLPLLKKEDLIGHFEKLDELITRPFLKSDGWEQILADVIQLKASLADYIHHLEKAEEKYKAASEPTINDNRSLKTISPNKHRTSLVQMLYKALEDQLNSVPAYTELNLIFFAPIERRAKYKYVTGLVFDFSIQIYKTFKPNALFVWKTTQDDESASAVVIARIERSINERVFTDKSERLSQIYGNVSRWTHEKVGEIITAITEDENLPPEHMQESKHGFEFLLEEGFSIPEAVHIEQQAQAAKLDKFANFWAAVSEVLANNDYTVAEERRHGETTWISPLCVSMRDLMSKCETKMEEKFPGSSSNFIPSYEYFRLQFVPRNSQSRVSKRYYGRFDVKFGLQKRTLHKAHADQHYGAKQFQFLKIMAGKFSEDSIVFFLDDKASIPVGFESAPVSATRRQRHVLMAGLDVRGLNAMDHDNIPQHLVPSVSIKLFPPKELSESWYRGNPTIILKDAIFEASSAFRHAAELIKNFEEPDMKKPILFVGTDGGPDHNVTSIQVMLSYVALFLELNLDYLCAVRTPPNFSVINPAERFMSTANIALIGVSLARNDLGKNEKKVRSLLSKKQWRDAQEKHPETNYRQLAIDGTKDARDLLSVRFQSLSYKGEQVRMGCPANDDEIEALKRQISKTFGGIDFGAKIVKSKIMNQHCVKDFFEKHVKATSYAFQVKKCTDKSCKYHKKVRLPSSTFNQIEWLPTPVPDGDKYKSFDSVYGNEPSDEHVPSKRGTLPAFETMLPKPTFPLAYTRARMIVTCTECHFPRLMYTKYALDKKEYAKLDQFFEDKLYVCGSQLDSFPEVFQNPKVSCYDPITLHYYQASTHLLDYKDLCAKCLDSNVTRTESKLLFCENCSSKTSKPIDITSTDESKAERRPRGRPKKK